MTRCLCPGKEVAAGHDTPANRTTPPLDPGSSLKEPTPTSGVRRHRQPATPSERAHPTSDACIERGSSCGPIALERSGALFDA